MKWRVLINLIIIIILSFVYGFLARWIIFDDFIGNIDSIINKFI